jgi:hypothetical protein
VRTKTKTDFLEVLRVLIKHEVEFIVVGGVSAALQGAPVTTFELPLVQSRDPENIERLLRALDSLDAIYRAQPDRRIKSSRVPLRSSLGDRAGQSASGVIDGPETKDAPQIAGEKDNAVLPILRQTLREKSRLEPN